jgi:carbonic anhydrase/acetyltransferase-like protein (isoleucine patch superfamily)
MIDVSRAAFIHPSALLFGKVTLGHGTSIWPYAVARAEMHDITIGEYTNIQDFVMIHVGYETATSVGSYCSITHRATLHGCTIGDNCLIGIGATVMGGAVIGENSIVAEHALVRPGFVAPPNSIVAGVPAKIVAERDSRIPNQMNAIFYHENALAYAKGNYCIGADPAVADRIAARLKELGSL